MITGSGLTVDIAEDIKISGRCLHKYAHDIKVLYMTIYIYMYIYTHI